MCQHPFGQPSRGPGGRGRISGTGGGRGEGGGGAGTLPPPPYPIFGQFYHSPRGQQELFASPSGGGKGRESPAVPLEVARSRGQLPPGRGGGGEGTTARRATVPEGGPLDLFRARTRGGLAWRHAACGCAGSPPPSPHPRPHFSHIHGVWETPRSTRRGSMFSNMGVAGPAEWSLQWAGPDSGNKLK